MQDLIDRQAAIDAIIADKIEGKSLNIIIALGDSKQAETLNEACDRHAQLLNALPSAQPKIIRCKDCKWYNDRERTCNDLMGFGRYWKPDDFCSYGKRRTDG